MSPWLLTLLLAADIDGTWTRTVGRQVQRLTLKSDGEKVTGSMEPGGGRVGPFEVSEGKFDGDKVTFKIVRDAGEKGKLTIVYQGTVSATELKVTMVTEGSQEAPAEQVFTKAK